MRRSHHQAGAIHGVQMNEQLANIKSIAGAMISNRDQQIARLESTNAELIRALSNLLSRANELPQYANHEGILNAEAIAESRAALERAKQ